MRFNRFLFAFSCSVVSVASALADEGFVVARTEMGHLHPHLHGPSPVLLERSVFPNITGWATGLHGFHSIDLEEPEEDAFFLYELANIQVVFVGAEAGLQIYNGLQPMVPNAVISLGAPPFDYHPLFNILPSIASGTPLAATFRLHDAANLHEDSEDFTITFAGACDGDLGAQGGIFGPDGMRDNNDFVVFIDLFFASSPFADVGQQGGTPGRDGSFDNNDFVVFIDQFFSPCG